MRQPDDSWLQDIYDAGTLIIAFVQGFDEEGFETDERTHAAVQQKLLVMGEAVKRLSAGFRAEHPEIDWASIAGMRDKLVHDYFDVDLHRVWLTATVDVPQVVETLERLIQSPGEA